MSPRSSRSHCTLVPAASITASTPHVFRPPCRHATIGNVPCSLRCASRGGVSSSTTSSIPPVPKVILASPRRTQPCPTSDACWSPTSAAIGGSPGSARASPAYPAESTITGIIAAGIPNVPRTVSSQPDASRFWSPVTAALVASVTCRPQPESVHATHVSTVPKHSDSARLGSSSCSSSQSSLVAD